MRRVPGPSKGWNTRGRGQRIHGMSQSATYRTWTLMKQRCYNESAPDYGRYGGRGVMVCERWHTFAGFLADMGVRPAGKTLDRMDSSRGYEPGNCRWATPGQQARNRRNSKLDEVAVSQTRWLVSDGDYQQSEVGRAFNIHPSMVSRIASGHYWR